MNIERVVYLLGTPFSGSTIIGSILSTREGCHFLGEIDRLPEFRCNDNPLDQCLYCSTAGRSCTFYTPEFVSELSEIGINSQLYQHVAARANASIVIDGSKHISWARQVIRNSAPWINKNALAVVCVRKPFQFTRSYHGASPSTPYWKIAEIWRDTYIDILRTINRLNIPYILVRNEDFRNNHEVVLSALSRFCGLNIHIDNQYDLSMCHTLGGNPNIANKLKQEPLAFIAETSSMFARMPRNAIREVLDVPGLYALANDFFGYQIHNFVDFPSK